jgi:hypothetical protein
VNNSHILWGIKSVPSCLVPDLEKLGNVASGSEFKSAVEKMVVV